jgi:glycosyltransferase involved in cell wall biosynthesis
MQGWPWTTESVALSNGAKHSHRWPRITIVTPTYNQGAFLEETIRSVLLQDYPNLEYFVIDGGSTDRSVEIIKKYEKWLAGWVSEKDNGQSHAINKGFARASGDWLGWINSDDCYAPSAISNLLSSALDENADLVIGESIHFGKKLRRPMKWTTLPKALDPEIYARIGMIVQPTAIWQRSLFEACGPMNEMLHYTLDWEFFIKCSKTAKAAFCEDIVAVVRQHDTHKSGSGGVERWREISWVHEEYLPERDKIRLLKAMPMIRFMREVIGGIALKKGPLSLGARLLRRLCVISRIYGLWGLPIEIWTMEEAVFGRLENLARKEFTDQPVRSVAEALLISDWHY